MRGHSRKKKKKREMCKKMLLWRSRVLNETHRMGILVEFWTSLGHILPNEKV